MDNSIIKEIATLGYKEKVGDIFINWENVKDEILEPERKTGTGNGTIHVFLGKEGYRLFQNEFPEYYEQVKSTNETADNAPRIRHIFSKANLISSIGHVCNYYIQKNEAEKVLNLVTKVATKLNESSDKYFFTESLFKWSTGSSDLRPYFKQFDEGFSKTIRSLLLPNSAYKICLYKNENNEYAAFWLIGFDGVSDFEVDSSVSFLKEKSEQCVCQEKKLKDFILRCVEYCKGIDGLDSIVPYAEEKDVNNPITVSKDGCFSLVGMFLEADMEEVKKRNTPTPRWFESSFPLGEKYVYLSTQWSETGNYQLTLPNFEKLVQTCYGEKFQYRKGQRGEHELWIGASKNTSTKKCPLPLQRILYGAPGTGKSYSVFSTIAIHSGIIDKEGKLSDVQRKDLEKADNIFRTTFHPDYDYAQFVGCYKPTKTKPVEYVFVKDEVEYKTELDKINSGAEGEKVCKRINLAYCNLEIAEKYVDKIDKEKEKSSYSDTRNGINLAKLHAKTGATQTPSITYEFVPQVFTNALVKAYEKPDESVYLVIEEINRGNCAQIFGDIFQLLDRNSHGVSEYSINIDEDLKRYLKEYFSSNDKIEPEYKDLIEQGKIKLPRNFSIIATMNTSDQSLFPMDSAFKRRWEWEYVKVDYKNEVSGKYTIKVDDKTYNWHTFLKAVNDRIKAVTSSEDKQMGNFFIKGDVDAKAFCNKVMFYLWNDISKDYYESNDSLFQTDKPVKDRKNNHFSFNELFGDDQTELLKGFMKFIKCDPV